MTMQNYIYQTHNHTTCSRRISCYDIHHYTHRSSHLIFSVFITLLTDIHALNVLSMQNMHFVTMWRGLDKALSVSSQTNKNATYLALWKVVIFHV